MHRHTDQLYVLLILTNLINVTENILTITNEMHYSDFKTWGSTFLFCQIFCIFCTKGIVRHCILHINPTDNISWLIQEKYLN